MIPMMVDILAETPTKETRKELNAVVVDFVHRLTGRQTIYQMIHLVEEVQNGEVCPKNLWFINTTIMTGCGSGSSV